MQGNTLTPRHARDAYGGKKKENKEDCGKGSTKQMDRGQENEGGPKEKKFLKNQKTDPEWKKGGV